MEDDVVLQVSNLTKSFVKNEGDESSRFFALKDVSFNLHKGEILGVIGANGSGKSTLLKILSKIYPPDSGSADYKGRLASIIDIGTGFHPDLTGTENVYLACRILGLSKNEIDEKLDEIVSFSGVGDFMNTAVKNFSSGMYLRLAFSVAFSSEVNILLLDEVIAVGDEEFRKKCYNKIKSLKESGVGIVLVSHHLNQVIEHCSRVLYLKEGKVKSCGQTLDIIEEYIESIAKRSDAPLSFPLTTSYLQISEIELSPYKAAYTANDRIDVKINCIKTVSEGELQFALVVNTITGTRVFIDSFALQDDNKQQITEKGEYLITAQIPAHLLNYGVYYLNIISSLDMRDDQEFIGVKTIKVQEVDGKEYSKSLNGIIRPKLKWEIIKLN